MRRLLLGLVVAVATLVPNLAMANDQAIARHIMSKLQLEQQRGTLKGFHVDMRVDQGTVWYQGFVSDQVQKDLILRTAQKAKHLGVVQVVDDITVRSAAAAERTAMTQPANIPAPPQPLVTPQTEEPLPSQDIVALAPQPTVMPQDTTSEAVATQPTVMPQDTTSEAVATQPTVMPQDTTSEAVATQPTVMPQDTTSEAVATQPTVMPQVTAPVAPQPVVAPQNFAATSQGIVEQPQMGQMPLAQTAYQEETAPLQQPVQNASSRLQPNMPSQMPLRANPAPGMPYGQNAGYMPPNRPMQAVAPAGQPMPMAQGSAVPMPVSGDAASLPSYAWPTYAAHPNYGAVTYPGQYSASAWPYIGPFYPYPQVPLGWRKVTLEWDDGWWWLDFHNR